MNTSSIKCTKCKTPLPAEALNTPDLTNCPSCGVSLRVDAFPALVRKPDLEPPGGALLVEGEAGCFYHPRKKAVVPCETCGRFLCALCDVELSDRHLCLACLEAGRKKGTLKNLETRRVLYDSIALALSIFPALLFWPTIVTAPMALFIALRHWKAPSGIIPRTKARFLMAIALAGLQILGWVWGIYYIIFMLPTK